MKITYDSENRVGYLYFRYPHKSFVSDTLTFDEGPLVNMHFDLDENGEVIGIEFMDTSSTLLAESNKLTIVNQAVGKEAHFEMP